MKLFIVALVSITYSIDLLVSGPSLFVWCLERVSRAGKLSVPFLNAIFEDAIFSGYSNDLNLNSTSATCTIIILADGTGMNYSDKLSCFSWKKCDRFSPLFQGPRFINNFGDPEEKEWIHQIGHSYLRSKTEKP
eukprot:scaffold12288_cov73-Cylindrotheca_fusiformis.AAC.1